MKVAFTWIIVALAVLFPAFADPAVQDKWVIKYEVPEDVKLVTVTLSYHWWDPKVEGDVSSEKVLLKERVKLPPGQSTVTMEVSLSVGKSVVVVGKDSMTGRGFPLDASFVRAAEPKTNYDGYYVLAQKPVDAKSSAAMGDVQNAAAWIELGVDPRP